MSLGYEEYLALLEKIDSAAKEGLFSLRIGKMTDGCKMWLKKDGYQVSGEFVAW